MALTFPRLSLSIGTKLLLSVLALLLLAILFLTVSTAVVVSEDKRAYTFQSQTTEGQLVGQEIVGTARRGLETLRILLGGVNLTGVASDAQKSSLGVALKNQSALQAASLGRLDVKTGAFRSWAEIRRENGSGQTLLESSDLVVPAELLQVKLPEILSKSFALMNLSRPGKPPLLGILMADLAAKDDSAGLPVAIGFAPVRDFSKELKNARLSIVGADGLVIYDTDPAILYARANLAGDPAFETARASRLESGTREYEFEGRQWLGSFVRPGMELLVIGRTTREVAMRATRLLSERFVFLGLAALGAGILFAILFARSLTAPILRLYRATGEVAQGNFEVSLQESSSDEIGALSRSFVTMSKKISELIVERERKLQIENELKIASAVQQNLIPPARVESGAIKIRSHYQSASECGGDWWGYFQVGSKFVIMVADATGHGLSSALITASAQSASSMLAKLVSEEPSFGTSPSKMLAFANRSIFGASQGNIMMTFFLGVIDVAEGKMRYSNAGHMPPWLFRANGDQIEHHSLVGAGRRLGEVAEPEAFEEHEIEVRSGDVLLLYTDGLTEARNQQGEEFSKKRAFKIAREAVEHGHEAMVESLVAEFTVHNERKPLDDDLTLVSVRIV